MGRREGDIGEENHLAGGRWEVRVKLNMWGKS